MWTISVRGGCKIFKLKFNSYRWFYFIALGILNLWNFLFSWNGTNYILNCNVPFRYEGLKGYYKGIVPNMLKVTPATAITFVVYENVAKYLLKDKDTWVSIHSSKPNCILVLYIWIAFIWKK